MLLESDVLVTSIFETGVLPAGFDTFGVSVFETDDLATGAATLEASAFEGDAFGVGAGVAFGADAVGVTTLVATEGNGLVEGADVAFGAGAVGVIALVTSGLGGSDFEADGGRFFGDTRLIFGAATFSAFGVTTAFGFCDVLTGGGRFDLSASAFGLLDVFLVGGFLGGGFSRLALCFLILFVFLFFESASLFSGVGWAFSSCGRGAVGGGGGKIGGGRLRSVLVLVFAASGYSFCSCAAYFPSKACVSVFASAVSVGRGDKVVVHASEAASKAEATFRGDGRIGRRDSNCAMCVSKGGGRGKSCLERGGRGKSCLEPRDACLERGNWRNSRGAN